MKISKKIRFLCLITAFAVLNLTLHSCQSDEPPVPVLKPGSVTKVHKPQYSFSPNRILTDLGAEQAADLHNDYCYDLISNITIPSDYQASINTHFNDITEDIAEEYELDEEDLIAVSEYIENNPYVHNDCDLIESEISNKTDFYTLIYNLEDFVLNNMTNYSGLETYIAGEITQANIDFTGTDLDAAMVLLETTLSSAYFWLPVGSGGSGLGYGFVLGFDTEEGPAAMALWDIVGRVIMADGIGAGFAWMLIGLLLVPTPVTVGALAAVVGSRAALTSINTLVNLLLED